VPAMLAQMQQQMQQMGQALQEAESGMAKAQLDAESRERVAQTQASNRMDVEELKGMIQLLVAQMQPPPVLAAKATTTGENEYSGEQGEQPLS